MARNDPQFNVRMPQELKEMIEASAKDNQRSINAEIVHHLRNAMEATGYINDDLIGARKSIGTLHIDSPAPGEPNSTAQNAKRVYKRKQKTTLQTDMPDEVMQELMARIQEVWDKYKAKAKQDLTSNTKDEDL